MLTLTTSGIQITVHTQFRADLSDIVNKQFFFNYRIDITNKNDFDVKLIARDWFIFDALNESRIVSGPGVVGEQPILKPNEHYTYTSGCDLSSEIGQMKGFYTFLSMLDGDSFQVFVPDFNLEYPGKMN